MCGIAVSVAKSNTGADNTEASAVVICSLQIDGRSSHPLLVTIVFSRGRTDPITGVLWVFMAMFVAIAVQSDALD